MRSNNVKYFPPKKSLGLPLIKQFKLLEIFGKEVLREAAMGQREFTQQELVNFIRDLCSNVLKLRESSERGHSLTPDLEALSMKIDFKATDYPY